MKKFYSLLISLSTFATFAQPANDDCQNAIPVQINPDYSCTIVQSGSLAGATASAVPDNGSGTPSDDVWFSFVATSTTHRFSMVNRAGAVTDLVHEVMVGTCNGLQSLSVSDPESSIVSGLTVGETYYLRVFSYWTAPAASATFDVCIGTPPAPPANDDCDAAITLIASQGTNCEGTVSGTLAGATPSNVADNGAGTPNDDVWYQFTATSTSHLFTFSNVDGSTTDLMHEVMSGDCQSLVSLSLSDPESSVVSGLTIGQTYYLRVFSYPTAPAEDTTFDVCITTPPTLTNDECDNALALTVNSDYSCGSVTVGTLQGATASPVSDNGAGTPDDDVWFTFVATATSQRIQILNASGSETDLVHEVLSGNCNSLTSLNVSDSDLSNVGGLTIGETYYVRVFSYYAQTNANTIFSVCVGTPSAPPANDDCTNAIAMTAAGTYAESAIDATVMGATATSSVPAPGCASYSGGDVWYSVVIPASGNLTIETGASSTGVVTFDSGMAIYSGTCGDLTLVSCDDDAAATNNFSMISLTGRTPGETVYIRIWEYSNDEEEAFSIGAYDSSLATASFDTSAFAAYPNPVKDVLNLSYAHEISSVTVFNLLGQQVISKPVNQTAHALDMSNLPSGTYLVKVVADGTSKTIKVVKQ